MYGRWRVDKLLHPLCLGASSRLDCGEQLIFSTVNAGNCGEIAVVLEAAQCVKISLGILAEGRKIASELRSKSTSPYSLHELEKLVNHQRACHYATIRCSIPLAARYAIVASVLSDYESESLRKGRSSLSWGPPSGVVWYRPLYSWWVCEIQLTKQAIPTPVSLGYHLFVLSLVCLMYQSRGSRQACLGQPVLESVPGAGELKATV
mmetsp:Transcript_4241/g.5856  ORF Transcript_4241/g.5856 Transcript_4241/m.5856 type:complete len:206 (-) Transcript_4241:383-1000(-)